MTERPPLVWMWLILAVATALVPVRASAANERKVVLALYRCGVIRRSPPSATARCRVSWNTGCQARSTTIRNTLMLDDFQTLSTRQSSVSISR